MHQYDALTTMFVVAPFPKGSHKAAFFGFSLQKKQAKFELHKSVFDDEKVEDNFIIKMLRQENEVSASAKLFEKQSIALAPPMRGSIGIVF